MARHGVGCECLSHNMCNDKNFLPPFKATDIECRAKERKCRCSFGNYETFFLHAGAGDEEANDPEQTSRKNNKMHKLMTLHSELEISHPS